MFVHPAPIYPTECPLLCKKWYNPLVVCTKIR